MNNNNYVVWGTARMSIETVDNCPAASGKSYSFLQFCVAFATFKTRPWRRMQRSKKKVFNTRKRPKRRRNSLFNRSNENALRERQTKFHNYRGLDLIKLYRWNNRVSSDDAVVKTRYIIMLQRKIRKLIKDKRRAKLQKILERHMTIAGLPKDVWIIIVKFIV